MISLCEYKEIANEVYYMKDIYFFNKYDDSKDYHQKLQIHNILF